MPIETIRNGLKLERGFENLPDILRFEASSIHMEREKPYAVVTVVLNSRVLAYDDMCLSKNEERVRLANSAYRMMEGNTVLSDQYSKEMFKHELDLFCRDVWPEFVGEKTGVMLAGDSDPSSMPYLLDPFVVEGGGTLLFGAPGTGKSWLLMLMAVAIDAGLAWPWRTKETRVLFTNIERSAESVARRLGMVNRALNLPANRPLLMLNARGKSLKDVEAAAERTIASHGVRVHMLDSISRAGVGDLTSDKSANQVTDILNSLCATWLALAHSPRPQSKEFGGNAAHVFGSVHFDAGADVVVKLLSQQAGLTLGVSLAVDKVNDGMRGFKQTFALSFDKDTGLSGLRFASSDEFTELGMASATMTTEERIEIELESEGQLSATQLAERLNADRTYITKILTSNNLFIGGRQGQSVLYGLRKNTPAVVMESTPSEGPNPFVEMYEKAREQDDNDTRPAPILPF